MVTNKMIVTDDQIRIMEMLVESVWQNRHFIPLFTRNGWTGFHIPDSRYSQGKFLDWILWRDRIIYVELKVKSNRPSAIQLQMMSELEEAGGEVYLWYPRMWRTIEEVLR